MSIIHDLYGPSVNTADFKKSVINMSVKFYNKIPNKITELGSFKSFNRDLKKKNLLNDTFYYLQDFFVTKK